MTSPSPDPFFDRLARLADEKPDRVGFEFARGGRTIALTRRGMLDRVRRLGGRLRADGHGDGARVVLLMENRPAWAMAHFSIWYSGGVSVPLDPQMDSIRVGNVIAHSEASLVITSAKHREQIDAAVASSGTAARVLDVDERGGLFWDGDDAPPPPGYETAEEWAPRVVPEALGALVYTSGTTGDPKGVMLEHRALLSNMDAVLDRIEVSEKENVLGVLPLYHMLPLIGNCVGIAYIGGRTIFLDVPTPESILAAFREYKITLFPCVPLFFYRFHEKVLARIESLPPMKQRVARLLMKISRFGRRRLGLNLGKKLLGVMHEPFGPDMRLLFTGGAKMNPDVHQDLLDWGFTLGQGYGLTESTAALCALKTEEIRSDSVGPPMKGIEIEIRDAGPDGIGEIWTRSSSLMRGYYKNEQATNAAIVDGWLRTGDLGRFRKDGHLTVTGRAKDVIVLASGKNVYPDELEEHYAQSEFIAEICVVGLEDPDRMGAERLHAVVVPDLEAARRKGYVNVRETVLWDLENLGRGLPSWQRLLSLDLRAEPLPRTTTRKVRRVEVREEAQRARRADLAARAAAEAEPEDDPHADRDRELLGLIAKRAGRESVRRNDHLDLDLGLDSLDRVELITSAGAMLGTRPGPEMTSTVHTVGELIDALHAAPVVDSPAVAVVHGDDARWGALLSETPKEYLKYLRRKTIGESTVFAGSRMLRLLFRMAGGFRVTGVENLPRDGAFLICPNHTSFLDGFLIAAAMPRRVLARSFFVGFAEYFQSWVGRAFARWVRNIPIDQNRNMERSLQAAAEGLRRGLILVAFPEGARSMDGNVLAFRRGPAILSRQLDTPIVPVGIWGAFESWPRDRGPRPHPIGVAFGPPIGGPASDENGDDSSAISEELRDRVIKLIDEARTLF